MTAAQRVTILLAPPGPLTGVRDTLQDWSALDLVSSFVWIERGQHKSAGETPALRIEAGRATSTTLEQELRPTWAICRLCVLVPGLDGVEAVSEELEDHVLRLIVRAGGDATVVPIRCVVTRPHSQPWSGNPARPEWHNLLISPEDRVGPTRGYQILDRSLDAVDLGPHAAAVVAGLMGLWAGIGDSPLDDQTKPPARRIRLARAFYRRLEVREVEAEIRDRVTSMTNGLPRPSWAGNGSRYVDEPAEATRQMSEAFWTEHQQVLNSGTIMPYPVEAAPIRAWEAIKLFFGFLWATITRGPERWYRATVGKVNQQLADQLQKTLFGPGKAEYAVVVGGIRADRNETAASWHDLARASDRLAQLAATDATDQIALPGRTPQPAVWNDLVSAALTLADAGDRAPKLRPLQASAERLVLRDPAAIAPGAEAAYTDLPASIAAPSNGLRPTDALEIAAVQRRLAAQSQPEGEIRRVKESLAGWQRQYEGAFTVRVGRKLADAVSTNASAVSALLQRLAATANDAPVEESDLLRRQRRLAILMWVLLGLMLVTVTVLVVLGATDKIEDLTAAIWSIVTVLTWLLLTAVAFAIRQRNLFAELKRRRRGIAEAEVDRYNLRIRLEDLRRTTQAYGEFLEWSRIIAVVVGRPFPAPDDDAAPTPVIGEGMPRSTAVGEAGSSPSAVDEAVEELRDSQYRFGWLAPVWQRVLAEASERLGARARRLRSEDKEQMYAEPDGPDDLLTPWADELEQSGVGTGAGDDLWSTALAGLQATEARQSLITAVSLAGGGFAELEEFRADVGRKEIRSQPFDPETLRERARVAGKAAVEIFWPRFVQRRGLGWEALTVELTQAVWVGDLAGVVIDVDPPERPGDDRRPQRDDDIDG